MILHFLGHWLTHWCGIQVFIWKWHQHPVQSHFHPHRPLFSCWPSLRGQGGGSNGRMPAQSGQLASLGLPFQLFATCVQGAAAKHSSRHSSSTSIEVNFRCLRSLLGCMNAGMNICMCTHPQTHTSILADQISNPDSIQTGKNILRNSFVTMHQSEKLNKATQAG